MPFTRLGSSRGLLQIHGPDAARFLQGMITNQMAPLTACNGFYCGILTGKGRVLWDVFIYPANHSETWRKGVDFPEDPGYFIECDRQGVDKLVKYLRMFKLRSKFDIRRADAYEVLAVWDQQFPLDREIGCIDPRAPRMGSRLIQQRPLEMDEVDWKNYTVRRIIQGVPEGQSEILPDQALPLESNMDYMNGIDFRKGCYVGQELTIRTHHQGVVRKRIVPIQFYPENDAPPANMAFHDGGEYTAEVHDIIPNEGKGRKGGKVLAWIGNIGLALSRIELMRLVPQSGPGGHGGQPKFHIPTLPTTQRGVVAFHPDWWPATNVSE